MAAIWTLHERLDREHTEALLKNYSADYETWLEEKVAQLEADLLESTSTAVQLGISLGKEKSENERLREAIKRDHDEGKIKVDKALHEFGYDSLRFADVRHGWIFSTRHGQKVLEDNGQKTTTP